MNIYIMYVDRPHRPPYKSNMGWQLYIETPCSDSLPWGLFDVFNYSTKPTKRQIRKAKKAFYKNIKSEIESNKKIDGSPRKRLNKTGALCLHTMNLLD